MTTTAWKTAGWRWAKPCARRWATGAALPATAPPCPRPPRQVSGVIRQGVIHGQGGAVADAAIDLSGRPWFEFDGRFPRDRVGQMSTEMVPHFFESLCQGLGANLHLSVRGDNAHHMVEACFKAVARCLRQAIRREHDRIPSTKGVLA